MIISDLAYLDPATVQHQIEGGRSTGTDASTSASFNFSAASADAFATGQNTLTNTYTSASVNQLPKASWSQAYATADAHSQTKNEYFKHTSSSRSVSRSNSLVAGSW